MKFKLKVPLIKGDLGGSTIYLAVPDSVYEELFGELLIQYILEQLRSIVVMGLELNPG